MVMTEELQKINFKQSKNILISNVTAEEISNTEDLKNLLIKQIEKRVRWRESIIYMIFKNLEIFDKFLNVWIGIIYLFEAIIVKLL